MNGAEAVRYAMQETGMTAPKLAKATGYSSASGVTERLRGKQDMRVDTFTKFMNAMGYEVIARSADGKSEYVIGDELIGVVVEERKMGNPALEDLIRKVVAEELAKATPGRDE